MSSEPGDPTEVRASRAGVSRTRLANALAAGSLVIVFASLSASWISKIIDPGNAFYLAMRNGGGPLLLFVLAPLLVYLSTRVRNAVSVGAARVRVEGADLLIDRGSARTRVPLAELSEGVIVRRAGNSELELRRRDGDVVRVAVPIGGEASLEALLVAAGIGPDKRTLRTRVGGWQSALPRTFAATLMLLFTVIPPLKSCAPEFARHLGAVAEIGTRVGVLAALIGLAWLIANASLGPEVVVGTDGITVRSALKRRFIAHGQIERVGTRGIGAVTLHLTDGTALSLGKSGDRAHSDALIERIERAKSVRSGVPEATARAEVLDRAGRSLAEWRAALGALLDQRAGYRSASLERGDLLRVLEDPDGPADRRIGAALALRVSADPEASTQVRVAASACADDRVRVALEKIADGVEDDDALEVASAVSRGQAAGS